MEPRTINYAVQICDSKSFQGQKRYCSDNRTEISKKSIASFLSSVEHCRQQIPNLIHNIILFTDKPSDELSAFVLKCKEKYQREEIKIEISPLKDGGISKSIRACYDWLDQTPGHYVYQVQDDYLFYPTAIYETFLIFDQIEKDAKTEPIISPWNYAWLWQGSYKNRSTPRAVFVGKSRYWIQYYDMSCSFFTSRNQFRKHWDEYLAFFKLLDNINLSVNNDLENKSLNYMLTRKMILGIVPIQSLSLHMQSEREKDPHLDWKALWDQIDTDW